MNGALSNINQQGFASASFHSWPDTLRWDAYSGDYGPNFVGLVLGSATYLVEDAGIGGLVAYGGSLTSLNGLVTVQTRDAFRRKVFVGPLKLLVTVDAGIIFDFIYHAADSTLSLTLSQLEGGPEATSTTLWLETTSATAKFTVTAPQSVQTRLGWRVALDTTPVVVVIGLTSK